MGKPYNSNKSKRSDDANKNTVDIFKPNCDYVKEAEKCMTSLGKKKENGLYDYGDLTTTQMRNIYNRVVNIYNQLLLSSAAHANESDEKDCSEQTLGKSIQEQLQLFKIRLVYESGRTSAVKIFCNRSKIVKLLDAIGDSKQNLLRYMHYMEALVAYHYYYTNKKDK